MKRVSLLHLVCVVAALSAGGLANAAVATSATATTTGRGYVTGIGDENPQMFRNPFWLRLHTKIVRYIAPYDAIAHRDSLNKAIAFIKAAEAAGQEILVAFYHSEHTPTRLPSVGQYQHDVQQFVRFFPNVHQYQSWNEANRGNVPGAFSSPSPRGAASYYRALVQVCKHCTVIGLDVLDAANIRPTLGYIAEFKREVRRHRTAMPRIWGLHNYSDVNRFESGRTRQLVRALGGQVWLTETGGLVSFGEAFPNRNGSGLTRAANALAYLFKITASVPQIKRLYLYDWRGGNSRTRFDSALTNAHEQPRAGYLVVCNALHARGCAARLARN
jgi:hypothetical protein